MQGMGYRMWSMSYGGMQDLESGMWEVGWKIGATGYRIGDIGGEMQDVKCWI